MTVERQLAAGVAALGLTLPDGAIRKLVDYLALLDKWNRVYNLTAVREPERMVGHHVLDSLAALPVFDQMLAARSDAVSPKGGAPDGENPAGHQEVQAGRRPLTAIDVGSGGGLPGIPLAIARPDVQMTLIDSVAKKTAFLQQAKAELGLANLSVETGRVEAYRPPAGFDVITSRAFSDLAAFVTLTRPLLAPGGHWLAMKGLYPHEEVAALPVDVKVSADHALVVPGLAANRHLLVLEPVR